MKKIWEVKLGGEIMSDIALSLQGSQYVITGGSYRLPVSCQTIEQACVHAFRAGASWEDLGIMLEKFAKTQKEVKS